MFHWLTDRRRRHILEHPFPPAWQEVLERNVAAYRRLDDGEQRRLRELIQVFVAEKHWEGCGGLELTDEIRVTIAGQACLLILGRDHSLFADVESILIYPSTVVTPPRKGSFFGLGNQVVDGGTPILGQAFRGGPVILAWDAVLAGGLDPHDGRNVVMHELAHKIDMLAGRADGTPPLDGAARRRAWAEVCSRIFLAMQEASDHGKESFLRDYAATNEAEFFAVATETFFERPRAMAKELPALYQQLADFYGLDLAARGAPEPDDADA
jgi:MtfA peptidase